jgi:hypothetical protein
MTNKFVAITLPDAGHAQMHALSDAELDVVAGGWDARDIILLRWIRANSPSDLPAVFTHGTANIC